MLTDHLSNTSWTLPALDLNGKFVCDAQGIGRGNSLRARRRSRRATGER
jgi:hypothetical protein